MNEKQNGLINDQWTMGKSSKAEAIGLQNGCNRIQNISATPLNVRKPDNCIQDNHNIKNGLGNSVNNSNVDQLINNIKQLDIDTPSTSGITSVGLPTNHDNHKSNRTALGSNLCSSDQSSSHLVNPLSKTRSDATMSPGRPNTLLLQKNKRRVLKISPEEMSTPESPASDEESKFISPDTDTQDELENSIMVILNNSSEKSDMNSELTLVDDEVELGDWRSCTVAGEKRRIDLKVIEPYKRVLSHGGYLNSGSHNAIITFSACFLPHKSRKDYNYVMDNLFFYILHTLNQFVTDDYILVYLHGGTSKDCIPTFSWLKRCYRMIDRKLKKNLKALYLVHPTFWLRTLVTMIRPFISYKFSRKFHFVNGLTDLCCILPIEEASIPDKVRQYDRIKMSLLKK